MYPLSDCGLSFGRPAVAITRVSEALASFDSRFMFKSPAPDYLNTGRIPIVGGGSPEIQTFDSLNKVVRVPSSLHKALSNCKVYNMTDLISRSVIRPTPMPWQQLKALAVIPQKQTNSLELIFGQIRHLAQSPDVLAAHEDFDTQGAVHGSWSDRLDPNPRRPDCDPQLTSLDSGYTEIDEEESTDIWTDGSLLDGRAGAGVFSGISHPLNTRCRVSGRQSIFRAELQILADTKLLFVVAFLFLFA